jgi:ankyrin repeat protein
VQIKKGRRRHRSRGHKQADEQEQEQEEKKRWTGLEQRAELMKKVPRCVIDEDRREVMGLLRTESTKRREAGLANKDNNADTKTTTREELTLLQGACLQGSSVDMVALLLINGAWPDVTTPVVTLPAGSKASGKATKGGRGKRASGGYTPLHLALIGCGRDRNKVIISSSLLSLSIRSLITGWYVRECVRVRVRVRVRVLV